MIKYCKSRSTRTMVGQVLADNTRMLKFVEGMGFRLTEHVEHDIVEVQLELQPQSAPIHRLSA
ncbi:hypothetical protein V5T82_01100 [Magnetovibrio sp. PR-2]|uniref:GNAT family N-acetyltransferase n=1 Tax=Magnetovibrio sp. PR-2 TaxID=3120356 RepID=UPI002FCE2401